MWSLASSQLQPSQGYYLTLLAYFLLRLLNHYHHILIILILSPMLKFGLLKHCSDYQLIEKLIGGVDAGNIASAKLLEKSVFQ